jgi:hypothetical protein
MQVDPIHQFEIKDFFPVFHIGGYQISFTNSALYMFIIVGLVSLFMIHPYWALSHLDRGDPWPPLPNLMPLNEAIPF